MRDRSDTTIRFEAHIRENEEDLLRYFQRRVANGADAAEAFGELLLTAWKLRHRIPDDPTGARMWLFVTARNVLRDTHRKLTRRSAAVERLASQMRTMSPVTWDETAIDTRDAIARLPEEDAELVRLVYWDGLHSHEAAAVVGINPSTARSRLSKAKHQLRAALETDNDRDPPKQLASPSEL